MDQTGRVKQLWDLLVDIYMWQAEEAQNLMCLIQEQRLGRHQAGMGLVITALHME